MTNFAARLTLTMKKPFRSLGNDLYFTLECSCLDDRFKDSEVAYLFKTQIQLTGYYDSYFFTEVNKEPRICQCKCGREFKFQWFVDGVEASFLD